MSGPAIAVVDLVKTFRETRALDGLTLEVPRGSVFGFLGPNGAGKTTAIRILLGLARADSGSAHILGEDTAAGTSRIADRIGYLPDVPAFYPWMKAGEALAFAASLFRLDARTVHTRTEMLLDLVGLTGVRTPIGGYSRGMTQRLGIAQALINSPELLILDEPTSALDPLGRHEVLELIANLGGRATVFFSTHVLGDVERVCDHVAVVDHGRVVAADTTEILRRRYGGSEQRRLVTNAPEHQLRASCAAEPWFSDLATEPARRGFPEAFLITITDPVAAAVRIPAILAARGWSLDRLEPVEASLEDVFVDLVSRNGARP